MKKLFSFCLFAVLYVNTFAAVTVTPGTLPNGNVQHPYSQTLQALGGRKPYTWTVPAGTIPAGLTLTSGTQMNAVLSGTPTTAGTYTFSVRATDANASSATNSYTVVITQLTLNPTQLTSLWLRQTPDQANLWDTWNSCYNTSSGAPIATPTASTTTVTPTYSLVVNTGSGFKYATVNNARNVVGNLTYTVTGNETSTRTGNVTENIGGTFETTITNTATENFGNGYTQNVTGTILVAPSSTYSLTAGGVVNINQADNFFHTVATDKYYKSIAAASGTVAEDVNVNKYNLSIDGATGNTSLLNAGTYTQTATGLHTIGSPTVSFSGKVGIGNTTPTNALQVTGTFVSAIAPTIRMTSDYPGISWDDITGGNARNFTAIGGHDGEGFLQFMHSTTAGGAPTSNILTLHAINPRIEIGINQPHNLATGNKLNVNGSVSIGSGTVDSDAPADGIYLTGQLKSQSDIAFTTKVINETAGDDATINSPTGRFRKDVSGSTFTLTNSFITANSIIILQYVTAGLTAGMLCNVVAGSGSAVITFQAVTGGAEAPNANADINFIVIN